MDGSKRSSHGNAYFAGLGPAKRIVFFDTLLGRLTAPEVEAVLAHELGHHKLRHIWKRATLLFAASLGLLWGLGQLIDKPWFYQGLGVSSQSPAIALILFMLIVPVFAFFLQPVASHFSRGHEFEADAYLWRARKFSEPRDRLGQALQGQRHHPYPRSVALGLL